VRHAAIDYSGFGSAGTRFLTVVAHFKAKSASSPSNTCASSYYFHSASSHENALYGGPVRLDQRPDTSPANTFTLRTRRHYSAGRSGRHQPFSAIFSHFYNRKGFQPRQNLRQQLSL
jgi:hypothetical protein